MGRRRWLHSGSGSRRTTTPPSACRRTPPDEIKKAYRRLARENHPDAKPDDSRAEARFKEIGEAYSVVGDAATRKEYDELRRLGASGFTGMPGGFPGGFGGRVRRRRPRRHPRADVRRRCGRCRAARGCRRIAHASASWCRRPDRPPPDVRGRARGRLDDDQRDGEGPCRDLPRQRCRTRLEPRDLHRVRRHGRDGRRPGDVLVRAAVRPLRRGRHDRRDAVPDLLGQRSCRHPAAHPGPHPRRASGRCDGARRRARATRPRRRSGRRRARARARRRASPVRAQGRRRHARPPAHVRRGGARHDRRRPDPVGWRRGGSASRPAPSPGKVLRVRGEGAPAHARWGHRRPAGHRPRQRPRAAGRRAGAARP
jgi:curved DNA-binding protein CbpA